MGLIAAQHSGEIRAACGMILYGTQRPNPPAHRLGTGPLPNARVVLQLTASAPEALSEGGRASVRVSLTTTQAREIADGL